MPKAIQILTTLEYLGPYASGTANHLTKDVYFGLILQVGVADVQGAAHDVQVSSSLVPLFQPWNWNATISLYRYPTNSTPAQPLAGSAPVSLSLGGYSVEPTIKDRLERDCQAAVAANDLGWIDAGQAGGVTKVNGDRSAYPWPAHLAQVGRYPFPIPHLLNLSFLLRIVDSGFPATGYNYFATVTFTTKVNGAAVTFTPQLQGLVLTNNPDRITIPYDDPTVFTCTQPIAIASLTPAEPIVSNTAETTDWQAHLVAGAADMFDFSARLIDLVRNATADQSALTIAVAGSYNNYITAELTALRELVAYGCEPGPDGSSLLTRICGIWVAQGISDEERQTRRTFVSRFLPAVIAQRDKDRNDPLLFQDKWLLWLKQNPGLTNNPLIDVAPDAKIYDPNTTYEVGQKVLLHRRTYIVRAKPQHYKPSWPSSPGVPNDWSCATATLSIYDSGANYNLGDVVVFKDQIFKSMKFGKLPAPDAGPGSWLDPGPDIPIDAANLSDRLIALEHLHLQFTQSDLLTQLILSQWQDVAAAIPGPPPALGQPSDGQLFQSLHSSAAAAFDDLDIRSILLQGNLQGEQNGSWSRIIAKPVSRSSLSKNIPAELLQRMTGLLNSLPGLSSPPGFSAPLLAAIKPDAPWLAKRMATLVPAQLDTSDPKLKPSRKANQLPSARPRPTRVSEGLALLVGDKLDAALAPGDDSQDNLRQMIGLCVLMRETTENVWRCLNVAYPMTLSSTTKQLVPVVGGLSAPTVVPVPQHVQDALRRAMITYNNQPLMSESPAHRFSKGLVPTPADAVDRLISFQHPSVTIGLDGAPQWKIPGLAFGRKYEFILGRVSNSGALPPSFAALGSPAALSFDTVNKNYNAPPSKSAIPYSRTVPLADLSFGSGKGGPLDKLQVPAIPPDVQPRAREVFDCPKPTQGTSPSRPTCPLAMLSCYGSASAQNRQWVLPIRKPTTDLLTWDRWTAASGKDANTRKIRTSAWKRFHYLARQENSQNDLTLDDPAVESLSIQIEGLGNIPPAVQTWGPSTILDEDDPHNSVQIAAAPIVLTINTFDPATGGAPPPVFDSDKWILTLRPGAIARVTLKPAVKAGNEGLFSPGILNPQEYTFLVEAANKDLPSVKDLKAAFLIKAPTSLDATSVDFALVLDNVVNKEQVRGAELRTQIWRWDGRPSRQFPFGDVAKPDVPQPPTPKLLQWELETFSTRLSSDASVRPMTRFGASTFVAHDDRSTELGATYYRSAIEVYNRYGSLVPEGSRSVTTLGDFSSVPGADGQWTRRYIPARLSPAHQVPKPAVKFVVPLTDSLSSTQASAASVLVVVQGPWYAIGGLAEDMKAEITYSVPLDPSDPNGVTQEAGADPITWSGKRSDLPVNFADYGMLYPGIDASNDRFHGPVGHTFDSSDVNPLWVSSSFVLDAPKPAAGDPPAGTFARVQFTRVVHREGVIGAPTKDLESQATDPVWVQFLPSGFFPLTTPIDNLRLDTSGQQVAIKHGNEIITLSQQLNADSQSPSDSPQLIFGLLLTEEVADLLGRKGQERFHDILLQPTTYETTSASWKSSNSDGLNLIGRIIVIQRQVNVSPPNGQAAACQAGLPSAADTRPPCTLTTVDELWREMFPPDGQDVIARIVAISPPIFTSVPISCSVDPGGQK